MADFQKGAGAEDPFQAMAVCVESPSGYDGVAEMARCFVEEYAMMGWRRERILRLFRDPRYAGAHAVYDQRGEAFVTGLLDEVMGSAGVREVPHA